MILRNFISHVPFVLCSLLAPDTGAPAGGGGTPAPAPQPAAPPEPEGDSIESKLDSAKSIIKNFFARVGELMSQLATANSEKTKLEAQFNSATEAATNEKTEHEKTKGELVTAKTTITGLTTERDNANSHVSRLEKLCGVLGVDPKNAVEVPAEDGGKLDNSLAGKWATYQDLRKKEKDGAVAQGSARKFWTENKEALQKYASSVRK